MKKFGRRRNCLKWNNFCRFRILFLVFFLLIMSLTILFVFHRNDDGISYQYDMPKKENNPNYYYQLYRSCYSHEVRNSIIYSDSVQYFDDLFKSNKQPKIDSSIFFVDSNCSISGISGISVRLVPTNIIEDKKEK